MVGGDAGTTRGALLTVLVAAAIGSAACNSILGNDAHRLATSSEAGPSTEGGVPSDAATQPDGGGQLDGALDAPGSGDSGDGSPGEAGSPGGAVAPTSGGIYTVGRVPDDASVGALADGGVATLTDDGFEFGETLCVDAGSGPICVTGALTP